MKILNWDQSLSVQVDEVDDDHRRLIDLFNILNRALEEEEAPDYIEAVIDELVSCTAWHFKHEERLMLKYGYEGTVAHKQEHEDLIESAKALQQKFVQQGKTLSSEDVDFIERWLTGHILGSDMELGAHLSDVM